VSVLLDGRDVCDERSTEPRRECRREVAGLIRVRQNHELGFFFGNHRRERHHVPVGRVLAKGRIVDENDFRRVGRRDFRRGRADTGSCKEDLDGGPSLLPGRDRLPRRAVERASALLRNDEDH
jgi:hypothetical protein